MLEGSTEFEATLVELDRIMRALSQENEALRALIVTYDAFAYRLIGLCNAGLGRQSEGLDAWLDMLRTRKRELLGEEQTT